MTWGPANDRLACAFDDGRLLVWNLESRSIERELTNPNEPVTVIAWHPTEDLIATGSDRGIVRLLNVHVHGAESSFSFYDTGERVELKQPVVSLAWSPRDKQVLACGLGGTHAPVYLWTLSNETNPLDSIHERNGYHDTLSLAWSSDGEFLAASANRPLRVYRVESGESVFMGIIKNCVEAPPCRNSTE